MVVVTTITKRLAPPKLINKKNKKKDKKKCRKKILSIAIWYLIPSMMPMLIFEIMQQGLGFPSVKRVHANPMVNYAIKCLLVVKVVFVVMNGLPKSPFVAIVPGMSKYGAIFVKRPNRVLGRYQAV